MTRLSPTLRRTFQLRDVDGLSIRETAEILGIPAGTVKAQSARARKKLKQLMQRALQPRLVVPTNRVGHPEPTSKNPSAFPATAI
jgi:transposase